MKLYKYKSLSNVDYVRDILINQRLYCTPHDRLNDPLEGVFWYILRTERDVRRIKYDEKNHRRVCSLSKNLGDIRLWSYYAGGHQGVAIEISLDDNDKDLYHIDYGLPEFRDIFNREPNNIVFGQNNFVEKLNKKLPLWSHEEEYRILSFSEYYEIKNKITGVYLGLDILKKNQDLLLKLVPKNIPVYTTKFDCKELKIKPDQRINGSS